MKPSPIGLLVLLSVLHTALSAFRMPSPWTWRCTPQENKDSTCVRELLSASTSGTMTHLACQLTCGEYGTLWPRPKTAELGSTTVSFLPASISQIFTASDNNKELLNVATERFINDLHKYHPDYVEGLSPWPTDSTASYHQLQIWIEIEGLTKTRLDLNTDDEKYSLDLSTFGTVTIAKITSSTYFGARCALETLSQLIDYEEEGNSLQIVNSANITDWPAFPFRALFLDTSRNYLSVDSIERTLDTMAANKLNTFHWHITDSHSFPLVLNSLPNMAYYGAYSSRQVYQPEDIRRIVQYGQLRGIRVVPEFDAPAHVGSGWQWGPHEGLGDLAVCVGQEPWQDYCLQPPCGQLNLANENMYEILDKIYREMKDLFGPLDFFHFGGDEVNLNCWNTTQEMVEYMLAKGNDLSTDAYHKEWSLFHERSYELLTQANSGLEIPGILWASQLTHSDKVEEYVDKNKFIIQIWSSVDDPKIGELLEKGYRIFFNNYDAWYLDCGFGAWVGEGHNWCSPYKGWQTVYDNSPVDIAMNLTNNTADLSLIIGGEAALWSEQIDEATLDSRLWPRASALAERLWSNPETGWKEAEYRIVHHRQRLARRGVKAERLQPEWCHQNEGSCYLTGDELP